MGDGSRPDEVVGELGDGRRDGRRTALDDRFTPAVDALVRLDPQEAPAGRHEVRPKGGRYPTAWAPPDGVGLHFDTQRRRHQAGHEHQRRRRADMPEEVAVHGRHRRDVRAIDEIHPRPDDVAELEPGFGQRALDDGPRRQRLGARVIGMTRLAVRPGVGRAGDPARIADDERPRIAGRCLPRTPARRRGGVSSGLRTGGPSGGRRTGAGAGRRTRPTAREPLPPPGRDLGIPSDRREEPREQRRPRHDRVDLQVLAGRVVVPADRAPARRASARPCRPSCSRRRRRRSPRRASSKPSRAASADGVSDEPPGAVQLLHRPVAADPSSVDRHVGHRRARRRLARTAASAASRPSRGRRRGRRPRARSARRRRWAACRRGSTPTLTVTPGQRPLSACRSRRSVRGLEDRAAALLGLDARMGRPPVDASRQRRAMPLRDADDVAVRARALEHQRDVGSTAPAHGCAACDAASRSPRPDWRRRSSRPKRQPAASLPATQRRERVQPGEQATLHVGHARARRRCRRRRRRTAARPRCPGRTRCPCDRCTGPCGPSGRPLERADDRVARSVVVVGRTSTARAELGEARRDPAPDLVDAGLGVAPAVDVHQRLEIGEERRQRPARRVAGARRAAGS